MNKRIIEQFLIDKVGYLKKSQLEVAKALWRLDNKNIAKNKEELKKDLEQIKVVQQALRKASVIETSIHEQNLLDIYREIVQERNKPKKRLYFDIEVSANVVMTWRIGREVSLSTDDILKERAVICICFKWDGEDKVHSLQWKNGDDKEMLSKFAKVIESANEVVTQNGDKFDIKWLRTRFMYHGIPYPIKLNSIDTLKMARAAFYLNSNKLDYMGEFLGVGKKIKTDYSLWKRIMFDNNKEAMNDMILYCKQDVELLQKVHNKIEVYCPKKKFKYV
jgi:DNA polymerase elongation subunit (family B)